MSDIWESFCVVIKLANFTLYKFLWFTFGSISLFVNSCFTINSPNLLHIFHSSSQLAIRSLLYKSIWLSSQPFSSWLSFFAQRWHTQPGWLRQLPWLLPEKTPLRFVNFFVFKTYLQNQESISQYGYTIFPLTSPAKVSILQKFQLIFGNWIFHVLARKDYMIESR